MLNDAMNDINYSFSFVSWLCLFPRVIQLCMFVSEDTGAAGAQAGVGHRERFVHDLGPALALPENPAPRLALQENPAPLLALQENPVLLRPHTPDLVHIHALTRLGKYTTTFEFSKASTICMPGLL